MPGRAVRRRDGLTLAATGAIPDRVRAHVLAQYHAELRGRARARIRAQLDTGALPLPIPYGYRRVGPTLHTPAHAPSHCAAHDCGPACRAGTDTSRRAGRAPARNWHPDHACADIVWFMIRRIQYGMTPARVAALLNADRDHPPLLTLAGRPRRWTARTIRALLTDPVLTGHSVWGRTHHGRPRPRHEWLISTAPTHPPLLDPATLTRAATILDRAPGPPPLGQPCPAGPRRRR